MDIAVATLVIWFVLSPRTFGQHLRKIVEGYNGEDTPQ